ncbi:MAG: hypothetical protein RBT69_11840 [Spirochaetia bacterium]|jgi:hypothetical protein|nr:hypothetical protein [Spirochaetia bacterium]
MEIKKSFGLGMTALMCILSASVAAIALVFVLSCSEPGASGGEGADFDASSYYTKAEIDGMLPRHGGNEAFVMNETLDTYGEGYPITKPSGYRYLILQASGGIADSKCDVYIGEGSGAGDSYATTLPPSGTSNTTYLLFFNLESYGSALKVWSPGRASGEDINAFTALWFR